MGLRLARILRRLACCATPRIPELCGREVPKEREAAEAMVRADDDAMMKEGPGVAARSGSVAKASESAAVVAAVTREDRQGGSRPNRPMSCRRASRILPLSRSGRFGRGLHESSLAGSSGTTHKHSIVLSFGACRQRFQQPSLFSIRLAACQSGRGASAARPGACKVARRLVVAAPLPHSHGHHGILVRSRRGSHECRLRWR